MTKEEQQEIHKLIAEQASQRVKIENIKHTCDEIRDCLLGNGKPGLVVRTDRLEQTDKIRSKVIWFLITSIAAVAAKVIADTVNTQF